MKITFVPTVLALLCLGILFACEQEDATDREAPKTTLTFTKAAETLAEKVTVNTAFNSYEVPFTNNQAVVVIDVAELSTVAYRVDRESGSRLIADVGGQYEITVDTAKLVTLTNASAAQTAYQEGREIVNEKMGDIYELMELEEDAFITFLQDIQQQLATHFGEAEGDEDVLRFAVTELDYAIGNRASMYENYHPYVTDKEDFEVSPAMDEYLSQFSYNKGPRGSTAYNEFLMARFQNMITEEEYDDYTAAQLRYIKAEPDAELAKYTAGLVYREMLVYDYDDELTDDIQQLLTELDYAPLKAGISTGMAKWAPLEKGKAAPDFAYNTMAGETVKLSDFAGKYVYIDVWATWCGPCKREAPHFEELAEKYANNEEIVFMGVSIDEDAEAWEKWVAEKDMKGVQVLAEGAWGADICKDYLIKGIPRFILIGKDGNIVDATAPRPSNELLSELLTELVGA